MRKQDPTKVRGNAAERRLIRIARTLKPFVIRVQPDHCAYDKMGVDAIVTIPRFKREGTIRVPVQVKSSRVAAEEYFRRYPRYRDLGVVVMVVNENRSDEFLRLELFAKLAVVHRDNTDFTPFFRDLLMRAQVKQETPSNPRRWRNWRYWETIAVENWRRDIDRDEHAT